MPWFPDAPLSVLLTGRPACVTLTWPPTKDEEDLFDPSAWIVLLLPSSHTFPGGLDIGGVYISAPHGMAFDVAVRGNKDL
jgi:hypothetical protein